MNTRTILFIIVGVLILLGIIRAILQILGVRMPSSVDSWRSYLRGQGAVVMIFLIIGGAGAGLSFYYMPSIRQLSRGGQLLEYRNRNPNEQIVYEKTENIESYSRLTVFTRAIDPPNSSATVTLIRSRGGESAGDIIRLESLSSSWMRLDQENSYTNMRVIIEPPMQAGTVTATQVDVLVYLTPK